MGMLNTIIVKTLPIVPRSIVHQVAKRYVAGDKLEDAVSVVRHLNDRDIFATMDVLGEFVRERSQAVETTKMVSRMVDTVASNRLKSGVSVKLTSLGLDIDDEFCFSNVRHLIERAKGLGRFVRIDMENAPYTSRTLNIYRRVRRLGLDNTGVVIQACLRRSAEDLKGLAELKPSVRLCKGIYLEPVEVAYRDRTEVQENYKRLLAQLFESGMHAAIATHDDVLLDFAREYIVKNSISKDRYEFQMLLGVRESKRDELVKEGHRVRIYVPFGSDWYGYSLRRLKENPEIGGHIFRAIFLGD